MNMSGEEPKVRHPAKTLQVGDGSGGKEAPREAGLKIVSAARVMPV
jgi:hypothetical protein